MENAKQQPLTVSSGSNNHRAVIPGTDRRRIHVDWDHEDPFCPLKKGKPNPGFYVWLKGEVKRVNDTGDIPQIVLLSTAWLRTDELEKHALYVDNGGPISGNGVMGVYKNTEARFIIFEMCRRIAKELPPEKYNFEWFLMWENDSGAYSGGIEWAAAMTNHIKYTLRDPRVIGTGTRNLDHIADIEKLTGHRITMYVEAWNYNRIKRLNWKWFLFGGFRKFRIQFVGFWETEDLYYEQKDAKKKQDHFRPGREIDNISSAVRQIYLMVANGINPSSVFDMTYNLEFWRSRKVIIPKGYDMGFHRGSIEGYLNYGPVKLVIERPELMKRKGVRKLLKQKTKEYIKGLRK